MIEPSIRQLQTVQSAPRDPVSYSFIGHDVLCESLGKHLTLLIEPLN